MDSGTMTSKGQITIPKVIRDELSLHSGTRVAFIKNRDGFFELHPAHHSVMELQGTLGSTGRALSVEEMDEAIADAASEHLP